MNDGNIFINDNVFNGNLLGVDNINELHVGYNTLVGIKDRKLSRDETSCDDPADDVEQMFPRYGTSLSIHDNEYYVFYCKKCSCMVMTLKQKVCPTCNLERRIMKNVQCELTELKNMITDLQKQITEIEYRPPNVGGKYYEEHKISFHENLKEQQEEEKI